MQKLEQRRKTNTPTSASQARGNCDLQLNKEETLSVASLKTCSNNPDVNQSQHTGRLKAVAYVLSVEGLRLMPCTPAKAKHLLKAGRAVVVKRFPFTIRLLFACENQTQTTKMGVDSGYGNIGLSAITEGKEVVSGTIKLDGKTSERLTEKRMYRNGRRNKKWYRKPRFLNRKKKEGWLPPSIQRRYDAHLKAIKTYQNVLPIGNEDITIEIGQFDTALLEDPTLSGLDYQHGNMYGYQNMRAYLMAREKGLCQVCHKEFTKGAPSHIHHIKERNDGGTNRPVNLAILHKKCHEDLHKKGKKLSPPKQYKASTFMAIINKKFQEDINGVKTTYGYKTFVDRNKLGLPKTHFTDAFVIAGGTTQERCETITITQKHKNNRVLQLNRKGFAPSIRKQRYKIQPKDLIWIDGNKQVVSGMHNKGKNIMVVGSKKSYNVKNIEKIFNFGTFAYN